jgi:hypothetical protein
MGANLGDATWWILIVLVLWALRRARPSGLNRPPLSPAGRRPP